MSKGIVVPGVERKGFNKEKSEQKARLHRAKLVTVDGQLVLEIPTLVRVPIELEVITKSLANDVRLTPVERLTLDGLLKGWSNKEIANALGKAERTVKFHVSALLVKFVVHTRGELMHIFGNKGAARDAV